MKACQDVSHAGRRKGLIRAGDGRTRSGLWGEMLRCINETRPSLVVAENVRGLLSAEADSDMEPCPVCMGDGSGPHLRALGAVLADLADIGYDAQWYGLRAADVGAAHGRFRVFIFAWHADAPSDPRWVGYGDGGTARTVTGHAAHGLTLLPTPEANTGSNGGSQHPDKRRAGGHSVNLQDVAEHLLPTPAVNDMGAGKSVDAWDAWTDRMKSEHGNGNGHGKSLSIEVQRMLPTPRTGDGSKGGPNQRGSSGDLMLPSAVQLLPTPVVTDSTGTRNATSGRSADAKPFSLGTTLGDVTYADRWGEYAAAITRQEAAFGWAAPEPTEPAPKGGRRLSAAFSEWLMGLSPGWITDPAIWEGMTPSAARNAQLKAAGNGVVPQQAYAAACAFIHDMRQEAAA